MKPVLCSLVVSLVTVGLACGEPVRPALEITPSTATLVPGQELQLRVQRHYPGGQLDDATGRVTYASSDRDALGVTPTGRLVARREAAVVLLEVTDPTSDVVALATFTVASTPVALVVTPNPAVIPLGGTTPFEALGVFSDGSSRALTDAVEWSSSDDAVATVDAAGMATAVSVGAVTVTARRKDAGIVASAGAKVQ